MQGMEVEKAIITREAREWDAQAYAQGNKIQEIAAFKYLQKSAVDFSQTNVLDIGCGTGNISAEIAKTACKVHGIDASNNMIEYAKKTYGSIDNCSFEQCFAEDFVSQEKFNRATTFFCLHWIKDKQSLMEKVNGALEINGEFFGTHCSTSDPEPVHHTVFKKIFPTITAIYRYLQGADLGQATDYHIISDEEFKGLLSSNGFQVLSYEQQSFDIVMPKKEFENALWPVLLSRPFMQLMPDMAKKWVFNYLFNECIKNTDQKENGDLFIPAESWGTKVFHARKIANI